MKKIFFTFLFLIFTLSSCFWGEWDWLNLYDKAKDFSIRVPKDKIKTEFYLNQEVET